MMSELKFPLEQQVPRRELCRELRDAGFPQDCLYHYVLMPEYGRGDVARWNLCHVDAITIALGIEHCAAPLVGEMERWMEMQRVDSMSFPRFVDWMATKYPGEWMSVSHWSFGKYTRTWYGEIMAITSELKACALARSCLSLLRAMKMKEEKDG